VSINATPGAADANSYETLAEAEAYWAARPHATAWATTTESKEALLITATRLIDALFYPAKKLVTDGKVSYYVVRPVWLGTSSTPTQVLAWPRTGMFTINDVPIPPDVIPDGLKSAVSELAGQLSKSDRLLDSEILAQGISMIRAGSVSLQFRGAGFQEKGLEMLKVLPDIIYELVVPWITNESVEPAYPLVFSTNR
jgi:hypothetical protein